jgi:hypothetical protein
VVAKVAPGVRKSLLELYPYARPWIEPAMRPTPPLASVGEARPA